MQPVVTIAVRELVEFLMRGGDIDNRYGGFDRALEGSRIHRKLQKAAGDAYRSEVFLSLERPCGDILLKVEGRADGVIANESGVMIDEIKTTGMPLTLIEENSNPVHWAQAMCYGYIYCVQSLLESIRIRLTYYQIETNEIKRFERELTFDALEVFFTDLLERYQKWAEIQRGWKEIRDASMQELIFPYPAYRKGQRKLAVAVYKTVRDGGKLFCQAPTGIGKTISTLFPAIKALGEGNAEKIFYLTAKTITRQVAESACAEMREKGLRMKSVTLTAKDKVCFLEKRECNPDACPYAKGHYDRVNDALYALLQNEDVYSREVVERYAREFLVCPFELALDLTLWSDCIIADYNYVFDPQVYLRRFFAAGSKRDYAFLIDEAHNLVDRARDMFSAQLNKTAFLQLQKQLDKKDKLRKVLTRINKEMVSMRKECGDDHFLKKREPYAEFEKLLLAFTAECEEWMKLHPHAPQEEAMLALYFDVLAFLKITDFYDERYVTLIETKQNEVSLRLLCLDPSYLLSERMKAGKAAILFSATLTPMPYFMSVLGGDEDSAQLQLPSPFPRENLCLIVNDRISTKYKDREASLLPIAEIIAKTAGVRTGNYIVYFPSYAYMKAVYGVFCEFYPDIRTTIQQSNMDEQEREAFLMQFQEDNPETLVGFCVLGGIYAEGIDLKGQRLIGTIIVGVGLPQINPVQDIIREYYDDLQGSGFAYAYRYPGMNKVMQAAGRVIRDETDYGVVVLIDDRYPSQVYQDLLPDHWQGYRRVRDPQELCHWIDAFWPQMETEDASLCEASDQLGDVTAKCHADYTPEGSQEHTT